MRLRGMKISELVNELWRSPNAPICNNVRDLTGIRRRQRVRKSWRSSFSYWAFYRLGQFIINKAKLAGVPVFLAPPAYRSKRCHKCGHIEKTGTEK